VATQVKDVMGKVAIAALTDASFADLVETMRRFKVGAVTVIDADRRPVGVVSEDGLLLKEVADRLDIDMAGLKATVEVGVITLKGRVLRHSQVRPFLRAVRSIDGVVEVDAELAFTVADLLVPPPLLKDTSIPARDGPASSPQGGRGHEYPL
jgi:CBS domain-containing protein